MGASAAIEWLGLGRGVFLFRDRLRPAMRALSASALLLAAHAALPPPCALNGALQPDGTCACYGPWRGDDCSQLALGAVPAASGYGLAPALRSSC